MPDLDAQLEAVYHDLLRELFLGTAEALRERLRPLTEPERAALYAELQDLLTNLPVMFKASERFRFKSKHDASDASSERRVWDFDALYRKSLDDPAFFASPQWVETIAWHDSPLEHGFWQHQSAKLESLCLRHRCLAFGLSPRKQIVAWFRLSRDSTLGVVSQFIVEPGFTLLDRAAPWIVDVLVTVAKAPRRYFPFGGAGFPQLLTEARRRFPEWNAQLEPFYVSVLENERFIFPNVATRLAPEILLAGFLADPLPESIENQAFGPTMRELFLGFCAKGLISRAQMLEAVLNRLVTANRPITAEGWRQYLVELAPTDEELANYRQRYLDLTGAFPSTAQCALDECAAMWGKGLIPTSDWIAALMTALRHANQLVGVKAWKLLLKAARPEDTPHLTGAAVEALSSPHKKLRAEVAKWLVKNQSALDAAQLAEMAALAPSLSAADRERLAPLIGPAEAETMTTTTPPEDRADALAAQVAALKSSRTDAVSHKRLAFLEGFLAGAPVALEAAPPDLASALEIDVFPYESPAVLADDFLEVGVMLRQAMPKLLPTLVYYERLLDGVQRFRDAANDPAIRKTLDPLVKQFERMRALQNDTQASFNLWWRQQFPNGICQLAYMWLTGHSSPEVVDIPKFVEPLGFRRAIWSFQLPTGFWLAMPTHHDGWIHPRVFAERLGALPRDQVKQFGLLLALYRLPAIPEARAEAWEMLPPDYKTTDQPIGWTLTIALGPDNQFEAAIVALRRFFQANPPTDFLYTQSDTLSQWFFNSGQEQNKKLKEKRVKLQLDKVNVAFRLFCAALRARFGIDDARAWAEGIPLSKPTVSWWSGIETMLEEQTEPELGFQTPKTTSAEQRLREFVKLLEAERACAEKARDRWLFNPEPITRASIAERIEEFTDSDRETLLIHLNPYLCSSVKHKYSVEYESFPAGAQRFFELGVAGLTPPEEVDRQQDYRKRDKFGFNPALLRAGLPRHVDVVFAFEDLSDWLKSDKPPERELAVELFHHWLRDGRAAPTALATVIARQLRATSKGYAYLDAALVLLSTLSESGRLLALLACEQALAAPLTDIPSRSLSLLLDRLERLLEETGRAVADGAVRANLTALASAKKTSDLGAKARRLAARAAAPGQLPTEIKLVAALLSENPARPEG